MLDQLVLWGSDQVCNIINLTGLANSVQQFQSMICVYSGSYEAGIIFWAAVAMVALLVIRIFRPK
jgi:hypothetical protein